MNSLLKVYLLTVATKVAYRSGRGKKIGLRATNTNFRESSSENSATGLGEDAGKISSIEMASDENESKEGFDLGCRY
ncbi:hypothetical protein F8M41_006493 [Gigaspora margarita]|uniref:Uncharacterized protein n=1 Tax=Gigaspora margarita TaxID=4874 RepID=A0A8H3X742_GIGMA|nr:hypothetical protein F8M41_006493 [Gigaspora margarita]